MTDLYLRENVKSRPTFARDLSDSQGLCPRIFPEGREDTRAFIWLRRLRFQANGKNGHLEPLRDGTYLLFDYKKRDPLSYNARTVRV